MTKKEILCNLAVIASEDKGTCAYLREIISYEGFFHSFHTFKEMEENGWNELAPLVLLAANKPVSISKKAKRALKKHAKKGNAILVLGLIKGLSKVLGIAFRMDNPFPFPIGGVKKKGVGEGYLSLTPKGRAAFKREMIGLNEDYFPLHGFGCCAFNCEKAQALAIYEPNTYEENFDVEIENLKSGYSSLKNGNSQFPAICTRNLKKGCAVYFGLDIVNTIRQIQEGAYVTRDGQPPADGMAPLDDGILKAEDGMVLNWNMDRRLIHTKEMPVPIFLHPITDLWRNLFASTLIYASKKINCPLSRVKFWPEGKKFVLHISHDTDGNDEEKAQTMLENLNQARQNLPNGAELNTTWCLIPPGYSPKLCQKIRKEGHELAFHFDAQSFNVPEIFSYDMFKEQLEETKSHTKVSGFLTNKNHYTRWEGMLDLFEWCEREGIVVDQSKGPSKCGTMGFPFGSAHPWKPMIGDCERGKFINCFELSFQSQDPGLQGPLSSWRFLVDACEKVGGVSHFIFHPAHVDKKFVANAMQELVEYALQKGALCMRSDEIADWVKKRIEFVKYWNKKRPIDVPQNVKIEHV